MFSPNANESILSYANNLNCKYSLNIDSQGYAIAIGVAKLQLERGGDYLTMATDLQTEQ
jgi:hypothetical protein